MNERCVICRKLITVDDWRDTHLIEGKSPNRIMTKAELTHFIKSGNCWECFSEVSE